MNTPAYVGTLAILAMTLITATACADLDGVTPQNGTSAPADWSPPFVATWNFDEASGTRAASGGSCSAGSDCDLTDNNTVLQDTTNFKEGVASADFTKVNDESLSCLNATCDELIAAPGDSFSYGCFARADVDGSEIHFMEVSNEASGLDGYKLIRGEGLDTIDCQVSDAGGSVTGTGVTDAWPVNVMTHAVCVFDNSADTIQAYINGKTSGSPATQDDVAATSENFYIGTDAGLDINGQTDECFFIKQVLTDAQICRMCSCGIDGDNDIGNEKCLCSGADPTVYAANGRNTTQCGGCTLPSCNAVAP